MSTYKWMQCSVCGQKTYLHTRYIRTYQGKEYCAYCDPTPPKPKPILTPQELRKKADEHYESALRADSSDCYQREMDYVQELRKEANKLEAELH